MKRRRVHLTVLVVLATVASLVVSLVGASVIAYATPARPANSAVEQSKTILSDTSIDAPSLWTAETGSVRGVLGWTGTDSGRHLNVMTSADGGNWGNKVILSEASGFRPGVARTGSSSSDSTVVVWTGLDPHQSLNVLVGVPPAPSSKLTLWSEASLTAPATAVMNGYVYLVWTGADGGRTLNVDQISTSGGSLTVTNKTILWSWGAKFAPTVVFDPNGQRLLMSWTGLDARIHFAYSTDGKSWTQRYTSPMAEWSDASPMMISASGVNVTSSLQRYFVAWRGLDAGHSVNVKYTTAFPGWPNTFEKAILPEQSLGGPTLGYAGASGQMIMMWTGTDPQHHLNVATLSVAYDPACVPASGVTPVPPDAIHTGATSGNMVSLTFDSDGGSPGNATTYLDILKAHGVHASFFVTGQFAQANPALVQRIVNEGNDIGDHTFDHPDLASPSRTDAFVCNELTSADASISHDIGRSSRPYFRPPYGSYNEQVQYLAGGIGFRTILWSIDPRDWDSNTTVQDILNRVLNSPSLGPGAIILMHVNSPNEPKALDGVVTGLISRGYHIVPLSQLLQ